jgi:hypothetical protein
VVSLVSGVVWRFRRALVSIPPWWCSQCLPAANRRSLGTGALSGVSADDIVYFCLAAVSGPVGALGRRSRWWQSSFSSVASGETIIRHVILAKDMSKAPATERARDGHGTKSVAPRSKSAPLYSTQAQTGTIQVMLAQYVTDITSRSLFPKVAAL